MTHPRIDAVRPPDDDELVAAALAAVEIYLEQERREAEGSATPTRTAWQSAALVAAQGATPTRGGVASHWGTIDRAGRTVRWSSGMLGTFD